MKVEITIARTQELPKGAVSALEKELLRQISQDYSDCKFTIRRSTIVHRKTRPSN